MLIALMLLAQAPAQTEPSSPELAAPPQWLLPPAPDSAGEPTPALKASAAPPSLVSRAALSGLGGVGGSLVGLGLTLALTSGGSSHIDAPFANASVSALLITGAAFTVHQALGGHGEPAITMLGVLAVMGGSVGLAQALDPLSATWLTTLIGALPAALVATMLLEVTAPLATNMHIAVGPGGAMLTGRF